MRMQDERRDMRTWWIAMLVVIAVAATVAAVFFAGRASAPAPEPTAPASVPSQEASAPERSGPGVITYAEFQGVAETISPQQLMTELGPPAEPTEDLVGPNAPAKGEECYFYVPADLAGNTGFRFCFRRDELVSRVAY